MKLQETLLNPKSIAVVGASRNPGKVGRQVLQNLLKANFKGIIYPVNPSAKSIDGLKVYPTLEEIPNRPDHIVLTIPRELVPPVISEAVKLNIPQATILTAGFAETDPKGKQLQSQIMATIKNSNTRVLGPNCLGVISPFNQLNAAFGPPLPKAGHASLISQSGAMITAVLDWAASTDLGIAHAVSLGNRIDLNENDLLRFFAQDTHTKVILMYIESFANAKDFFTLASTITPKKPIILLIGGRSKAGQKASASHTAALASNTVLISAFAKQTGVILADNIHQWLNTANLLLKTPVSNGKDVLIVTNAGGPGVITADEASQTSLSIRPLSISTKKLLTRALNEPAIDNPLDLKGDAVPDDFAQALKIIAKDKIQDQIIIIITPQTTTNPPKTARLIAALIPKLKKPVVVVLMGGREMVKAKAILDEEGILNFTYPGEAVTLLAIKNMYEANKKFIKPYPAVLTHTLTTKPLTTKSSLNQWFSLLTNYGFTLPKFRIIDQVSAVPEAISFVQRPAVIKTASTTIAHKALRGGVYKDIMTVNHARLVFHKLTRLHPEVLVQQQIKPSLELLIGAKRDPQLGPFITVGLGGSFTNYLADRNYAFLPCTPSILKETLIKTKAYPILKKSPRSLYSAQMALQHLQQIMLEHPEIDEMEINPLLITSRTAYAVDIKITVVDLPVNNT
jgi:acetyl coenzyme A synthetase (ADP forming)-like protein